MCGVCSLTYSFPLYSTVFICILTPPTGRLLRYSPVLPVPEVTLLGCVERHPRQRRCRGAQVMAAKHTGTYYNLSTILFVQYVLNAILLVMLWQQSLHSFSWKLQLNVYATFCESDTASDITLAVLVSYLKHLFHYTRCIGIFLYPLSEHLCANSITKVFR